MTKRLTCIECPKGCTLSVDMENCKVLAVYGNECPKGEKYAIEEVANPVRVLTSTVLTIGLPLKMLPVRTDRPISKDDLKKAMKEIKNIRVDRPVRIGAVIAEDLLGSGANLIATRDCG